MSRVQSFSRVAALVVVLVAGGESFGQGYRFRGVAVRGSFPVMAPLYRPYRAPGRLPPLTSPTTAPGARTALVTREGGRLLVRDAMASRRRQLASNGTGSHFGNNLPLYNQANVTTVGGALAPAVNRRFFGNTLPLYNQANVTTVGFGTANVVSLGGGVLAPIGSHWNNGFAGPRWHHDRDRYLASLLGLQSTWNWGAYYPFASYPNYGNMYPVNPSYSPPAYAPPSYGTYPSPYGGSYDPSSYGTGNPAPEAKADTKASTPPASTLPAPPVASKAAHIEVIVPDVGAKVWFNGSPMEGKGTVRYFNTPELAPGTTYSYTVRAIWDDGNRTQAKDAIVYVTAGAQMVLDFTQVPPQTKDIR